MIDSDEPCFFSGSWIPRLFFSGRVTQEGKFWGVEHDLRELLGHLVTAIVAIVGAGTCWEVPRGKLWQVRQSEVLICFD
jgi:hypothetical protein